MYSFLAFESCLHAKFFLRSKWVCLFVREGGHRTVKALAFVKWMEMWQNKQRKINTNKTKSEIWNRKKITNTTLAQTGRPNKCNLDYYKNENKLIVSKYIHSNVNWEIAHHLFMFRLSRKAVLEMDWEISVITVRNAGKLLVYRNEKVYSATRILSANGVNAFVD